MNFQIDALEAEFERASGEGDRDTLVRLQSELLERRPSRRVTDLLSKVEGVLGLSRRAASASESVRPAPTAGQPGSGAGNGRNGGRAEQPPPPARGRANGNSPTFTPTPEQKRAVELFRTGQSLKINAYAGSGKTSTLQLLAHSSDGKGQYLAFNKKIVADSDGKFPASVNCNTTHSLAYRSLVGRYPPEQLTRRINANELVEVLGLKSWRVDKNHTLAARSQAFLILATIRRYCQSDTREFLAEHVPRHGSLAAASEEVLHLVTNMALRGAEHVWGRMLLPSDPLPLGHDGYLKAWALSDPLIAADYILLDEAQDTNPVVLGVLKRQSAQLVYVGDKFQQIYEWRGAVNAMEQAEAVHSAHLTTSFRFGGDIADAANRVLRMLGEDRPLTGNPNRHSRIQSLTVGTVLARTNASTITACIEALDLGKRPHLVGGTVELMNMLRGVQDLKQGVPSSVPEFFGFQNWQEVLEFVRSGEGEDLLTFVNLVEMRGEAQLFWALNRTVEEDQADTVVSTAHKAKGREWDNVRLMDDFLKSLPLRDQDRKPTTTPDPAELRLLYVALTRAKVALDVPALLMQFIRTGILPETEQRDSTPRSTRPADRGPLRDIPPRQPDWRPPPNWEPPASPRSATTAAGPQRQATPAVPPTPALTKKVGFFRRLLGG